MGIVDLFISVEDTLLFLVVVRAAEIVIVVAGRVITPGLNDTVVGDGTAVNDGVKPFLIGTIFAFLDIIEAVETHVLQGTRGSGESIGLCGLLRNLSPLGGCKGTAAVDE